jgi:hypothetical protein
MLGIVAFWNKRGRVSPDHSCAIDVVTRFAGFGLMV